MCVWHPEADSIAMDNKALDIIYRNNRVDAFLGSMRSLGISAIKGQGKTFLLKAKRKSLSEKGGILLLPKDSVMVDALNTDINIKQRQKNFLLSYTNWVSLWKTAIAITILQHPDMKYAMSEEVHNQCCDATKGLLNTRNDNFRPSIVVYRLIDLSVKDMNKAFADLPKLLQCISYIDRPVALFIDKTDQAFSHHAYPVPGNTDPVVGYRNASIWQFSQLALAHASYDIFSSSNPHIKVYFTIRQESLLDAERVAPNLYRNFSQFITPLEYSKKDLYGMFALYIAKENNRNLKIPNFKESNPELAFVGIDKFTHGYVDDDNQESLFAYIYRHSMGRSSDIQQICYDIYMEDVKDLDIDKVRHIVNTSARKLLKQYIAEIEPFTIEEHGVISTLLSCINTNTFNLSYMRAVCKRYMLLRGTAESCKMQCEYCTKVHPFAQLYNIGLLGYLHSNESSPTEYEQRFLSPTNRIILGSGAHLDNAELFFLHPSVSDWAKDLRNNNRRDFHNSHRVIIENERKCSKDALNRIINDLHTYEMKLNNENVFISSTMTSFKKERSIAAEALAKKGYYPVYCDSPNYVIDPNFFSHDACVNEILKCNSCVVIFGCNYGGEYVGSAYALYADEIVERSNGKIERPSITLMEYYSARRQGKKYLVIMSREVEKYRNSDECKHRKNLPWKEKSDIDKMAVLYDFINHLKISDADEVPVGNMMVFYDEIGDIAQHISNYSFGDISELELV